MIFSLAFTPHSPPGSRGARWQTRTAAMPPSPAGWGRGRNARFGRTQQCSSAYIPSPCLRIEPGSTNSRFPSMSPTHTCGSRPAGIGPPDLGNARRRRSISRTPLRPGGSRSPRSLAGGNPWCRRFRRRTPLTRSCRGSPHAAGATHPNLR